MHPADRTRRRRTVGVRIVTVGALALTPAGCGTLDDTGAELGRGGLVSDLSAQLDRSSTLTYSADYRLAGGDTATIVQAQRPRRSAYVYPGGKVTVTADATTECRTAAGQPTCTVTAAPRPADRPPAALGDGSKGLVTPGTVLTLLEAAALDSDAAVTQHDTTIAGRHASCVRVDNVDDAAAARFDACVTTEGVLGSFSGTVDGDIVDLALTGYDTTADSAAFAPPPAATVLDRR